MVSYRICIAVTVLLAIYVIVVSRKLGIAVNIYDLRGHREYSNGEKVTNVAFLKIHKTGGTTMMNILTRFALHNNLNVAAPMTLTGKGWNYLGYRKTLFEKNIVPLPENEKYNILTNHVIYKKTAFSNIMPNTTIYIGIVRNPNDQFVSSLVYYGFYRQLMKTGITVSQFLRQLRIFHFETVVNFEYLHNKMSRDFGIPGNHLYNTTFLSQYMRLLDDDIHLVMLTEYYEESIILLKRLLNWDLKDVLYTPRNNLNNIHRPSLSMDDISRLRQWNYADNYLYDFFKLKLLNTLRRQDSDFFDELANFKVVRMRIEKFCTNNTLVTGETIMTVPATRWNVPFEVTSSECYIMSLNGASLTKLLIRRQWFKINLHERMRDIAEQKMKEKKSWFPFLY